MTIPLLHGDKMLAMAKPGRWFKATAPISCGVYEPISPRTFPPGPLLRVDRPFGDGTGFIAHTGDGVPIVAGLQAAVNLIPIVLDGDEVVEREECSQIGST